MLHSVSHHLRIELENYDQKIRQFVPGYETMLNTAAAMAAHVRPNHVLDLGCGSGGLSEQLLKHHEIGTVELWDIDEEMLERAKNRLSDYGGRTKFSVKSFHDPFPQCAAITACISLHHVLDLKAKTLLYRRAFDALDEGGIFVNADTAIPTSGPEKERLYRYWADHLIASGIKEDRAWKHFEEWAEEDAYFSLADELKALETVGFESHCVWREGPNAVIVGRR
ncbi:MAG: class I SAM-dependent methyltransferase [Longimicrobiales bacterium]